jgi:predicted transcriptional regulator
MEMDSIHKNILSQIQILKTMARRGRPKKELTVAVKVDHAKLLKQSEQEQKVQMESLYKDLAKIKHQVDLALTQIGFMDSAENLSEAAFKAGRAYCPLDKANDKLEQLLEYMYAETDFDHWEDVANEN